MVSKNLISFLKTDCRYLKRRHAVCLSPVCIQHATPANYHMTTANITFKIQRARFDLKKSKFYSLYGMKGFKCKEKEEYQSMMIRKQPVQDRPGKENSA